MRRARFLEQERRQEAERSIKYRGTARIKLDALHFPCEESREPDKNNVERLKNLFHGEGGCRRLDLRNHIPAFNSQPQLEAVTEAIEISTERLLEDARGGYPEPDFPPGYRRWKVDLYLKDLTQELEKTLIEEYSAEKEPDDGEIYSKIRKYQGYRGAGIPYFEKRWAGRGMRLSTTHTMFATRCQEENLCYVDDTIRDFWTKKIFREDREIFGAFNEQDRGDIWSRVLSASADRLIPSLFSFFEDINYLKNVAEGVKSRRASRTYTRRSITPTYGELQTTADQEVVGNPIHSTQPGTDSSATNNSNSISGSGKIPDHVTNSEEQIQAVEPQITRQSSDQGPDLRSVRMKYKIRDRGVWKVPHTPLVDPSDPSEARRVAIKYMRKRIHMFDTSFCMLTPQTYFEDVTADGTNTILLIPEWDIDTDNLPTSVSEERPDLQTNSEADPSIPELNPENGSKGEELFIREAPGAIQAAHTIATSLAFSPPSPQMAYQRAMTSHTRRYCWHQGFVSSALGIFKAPSYEKSIAVGRKLLKRRILSYKYTQGQSGDRDGDL
ncbi:hypothetical protein EPUS_06521 [Endocarpon pusillum Z07020]|uniref:Uncharacterized protein n=1 Tax=Endocarpon pusillum (strain Z07020 / HMAS-L-300199) TaxID=1263415 RepID=U1G3T0_ENDPU|nr:uncharacterized protein EPUS_06521 [Endocarpon pusillum Z07020]ERF71962.1 hypothetical protein EPUS_06521 [Endocarpon pusillum Z07020]